MRAPRYGLILGFIMANVVCSLYAQTSIPIGQWRIHASYTSIVDVAVAPERIYAAASNGIMVLDRNESSVATMTRLNGLRGAGITQVAYHQPTDQLIIIYDDGTFDVIRDSSVTNFDPSKTTTITGARTIHRITLHGNNAYMATAYGVLVFDLTRSEIKETWRDIGEDGTTLSVNGSAILGDSIFLATSDGVLAGKLADNLLDYSKWKRSSPFLDPVVSFIQNFNSRLIAVINNAGVYEYVDHVWNKKNYLDGIIATDVNAGNNQIFVSTNNTIYAIDDADVVTTMVAEEFRGINSVAPDESGKIWVGDSFSGLLSFENNQVQTYLANGPVQSLGLRLRYLNKKIFFTHGGYDNLLMPIRNGGAVSIFQNGSWSDVEGLPHDITDVAMTRNGKFFFSSFGYGVQMVDTQGDKILYDETNSTLDNIDPPGRFVNVTSLIAISDDVWVTNYGSEGSLHKLSSEGNWQSLTFPVFAAQYPLSLERDYANRIWVQLNPSQGGGLLVHDPTNGEYRYLTDADNNGELPSRNVHALEADLDGNVWVGTDRGAAYFFDAANDAVRPIIGNVYLLLDDRVTAIETDGGNRKWMGTERGLWLISPSGESSIAHFTTQNSPLLSDRIIDIEIDHGSGEVFILTDKGLVSYRGDATIGEAASVVKIFPNPIHANFTGRVGISGLPADAEIKITDISGKLVWQSRANGGSISWDARGANGNRVSTGIYLVFAATGNGSQSIVGKLAVVN